MKIKSLGTSTIILTLFFCILTYTLDANNSVLRRVVIDAGHGGEQPGAVYGAYKEKDVTLSVALKLGALINKKFPEVEVIYTRKTDVAVDLSRRSKIASESKADLFISIHVNSTKGSTAKGTETFVMGADKSDQNLDVAMLENSVISYEENYEAKYEGFDPTSAESYIVFSLMQYSFLEQSLSLAAKVQEQFTQNTAMSNRGVKQAGFLVLWKTTMPSILTEIGFISNASDRAYILSEQGKNTIAESLLKAFSAYKAEIDSGNKQIVVSVPQAALKVAEKPKEELILKKDIRFSVQVKSSPVKLTINNSNFGNYAPKVKMKYIDGKYKYFVAEMDSYKDALSLQAEIRRKKFKDAFIVAFARDKQLTINEALSYL